MNGTNWLFGPDGAAAAQQELEARARGEDERRLSDGVALEWRKQLDTAYEANASFAALNTELSNEITGLEALVQEERGEHGAAVESLRKDLNALQEKLAESDRRAAQAARVFKVETAELRREYHDLEQRAQRGVDARNLVDGQLADLVGALSAQGALLTEALQATKSAEGNGGGNQQGLKQQNHRARTKKKQREGQGGGAGGEGGAAGARPGAAITAGAGAMAGGGGSGSGSGDGNHKTRRKAARLIQYGSPRGQ
jgi:DNA repair exonuclease SbcCD ATPase subunit